MGRKQSTSKGSGVGWKCPDKHLFSNLYSILIISSVIHKGKRVTYLCCVGRSWEDFFLGESENESRIPQGEGVSSNVLCFDQSERKTGFPQVLFEWKIVSPGEGGLSGRYCIFHDSFDASFVAFSIILLISFWVTICDTFFIIWSLTFNFCFNRKFNLEK